MPLFWNPLNCVNEHKTLFLFYFVYDMYMHLIVVVNTPLCYFEPCLIAISNHKPWILEFAYFPCFVHVFLWGLWLIVHFEDFGELGMVFFTYK